MILAELQNWQECRTAFLEYDNDTIYLYSYPHNDNIDLKSLWVGNTKKRLFGKSDIKSDIDKGIQPYMPKKYCSTFTFNRDFKNKENWELQWGLDQNSVAVYFKNNLVAVMPEWSGLDGFHGYSKGALGETPLAWELTTDNIQIERFQKEREFLNSWTEASWITHQESLLKTYDSQYKGENRYFAADGGKWPPLGIHYCSTGEIEFLATVGMSQLPMPLYGMQYEDPRDFRRIELAIIIKQITDFKPLTEYLSGQSSYPWYFGTHFDNGHTAPCSQLNDMGATVSFMALSSGAKFLPKISIPDVNGDKVRLLFMVPIHESEQKYAEKHSTKKLIEKLESECDDPQDIFRRPIV